MGALPKTLPLPGAQTPVEPFLPSSFRLFPSIKQVSPERNDDRNEKYMNQVHYPIKKYSLRIRSSENQSHVDSSHNYRRDLGGISAYQIEHNFAKKHPTCFSRRERDRQHAEYHLIDITG